MCAVDTFLLGLTSLWLNIVSQISCCNSPKVGELMKGLEGGHAGVAIMTLLSV